MDIGGIWWIAGEFGGLWEDLVECRRIGWTVGKFGRLRGDSVDCGRIWWIAGGFGDFDRTPLLRMFMSK